MELQIPANIIVQFKFKVSFGIDSFICIESTGYKTGARSLRVPWLVNNTVLKQKKKESKISEKPRLAI
jgi:hypothetical protein